VTTDCTSSYCSWRLLGRNLGRTGNLQGPQCSCTGQQASSDPRGTEIANFSRNSAHHFGCYMQILRSFFSSVNNFSQSYLNYHFRGVGILQLFALFCNSQLCNPKCQFKSHPAGPVLPRELADFCLFGYDPIYPSIVSMARLFHCNGLPAHPRSSAGYLSIRIVP
jgi:hypothetical protein